MVKPEVYHVEHAVPGDRRRHALVQASRAETVFPDDLLRDGPRAGELDAGGTVRLQRDLHDFERVYEDGFGDAGAEAGQRERL